MTAVNDTSTTDIINRLRDSLRPVNPPLLRNADIAAAANEIERLRERCEGYKGQVEAGAIVIEHLRANRASSDYMRRALLEVQEWDRKSGALPSFVAGMVNSALDGCSPDHDGRDAVIEGCAKIAETWHSPHGGPRDVEVKQAIAAAIRATITSGQPTELPR